MRYHVLATDFDGTLAGHGVASPDALRAIERLRATGRRTVLVTGRIASDLAGALDRLDLFDRVVAENGATLVVPGRDQERVLARPPPESFTRALAARGVPFTAGKVVVATWEPHQLDALEVIRDLGLELSIVFNKGAVMVLPDGVNKATGLAAALEDLGVTEHEVVAVGDAENDHVLLLRAECGAAVANALPALREAADVVTAGARGAGVAELAARLAADDLASADPARRDVPLGEAAGRPVAIRPGRDRLLLAGGSGSGKTTAAATVIERFLERRYQVCVIDPEGDYEEFPGLTALGTPRRAPTQDEVLGLLYRPGVSPAVNLLAVRLSDRPGWFAGLFSRLQELRARTGRPHLWVADEAHHIFPREWQPGPSAWPADPGAALLVTLSPERLAPVVLRSATAVLTIGDEAERAMAGFLGAVRRPAVGPVPRREGEALGWFAASPGRAVAVRVDPPAAEHRRHRRKYAHGDLGEKAFRFRGRDGRLDLRATNLDRFLDLAAGVDEDTWRFHLERGDYDAWLRDAVKDPDAADEVEALRRTPMPAEESRRRLRRILEQRYMIE